MKSHTAKSKSPHAVVAIDIGGTNVKVRFSGSEDVHKIPSGPTMTPTDMVTAVKEVAAAGAWKFDVISIGYPGLVIHGVIGADPANLGAGWHGFDFAAAFGCPVRIINDAAMQALGSYDGGSMLFLGLGTGLGTTMIIDGTVVPMELAHLPYRKGRTFEEYTGAHGLLRLGKKKWRKHTLIVVEKLRRALGPDYIVLGGGNAERLESLPEHTRLGANANAFIGGFRMWDE